MTLKSIIIGCIRVLVLFEYLFQVLSQYSFVTSLYSVYDSNVGQGAYSSGQPDDRPEVRYSS